MIDPVAKQYFFLSARLSKKTTDFLHRRSANPICTVETLGVLVGTVAAATLLQNRPVICWIDNEASRAALVRGTSSDGDLALVLQQVAQQELKSRFLAFFDRVPTLGNVADAPSRGRRPVPLPGLPPPSALRGWEAAAALSDWGIRDRST